MPAQIIFNASSTERRGQRARDRALQSLLLCRKGEAFGTHNQVSTLKCSHLTTDLTLESDITVHQQLFQNTENFNRAMNNTSPIMLPLQVKVYYLYSRIYNDFMNIIHKLGWISCIMVIIVSYLSMLVILKIMRKLNRIRFKITDPRSKLIAFFHPTCADCGHSELVLWAAIHILHQLHPLHTFVIYSDNYESSLEDILIKVQQTFNIETATLRTRVRLVKLWSQKFEHPYLYPFASFNTFLMYRARTMCLEGLFRCPPDVLIDTTGASFIYLPIRKLAFCPVVSYVNVFDICDDSLNSFYSFYARILMCNSTWTEHHIRTVWGRKWAPVLHPPCNVEHLKRLPLTGRNPNLIISIAQFCPEKNHQLQLEALAKLVKLLKKRDMNLPQMAIIGSARQEDDFRLINELKSLCRRLDLEGCVQFHVNLEYARIVDFMGKASIALHTMRNEPFGHSVVEFQAAGLLTVAHDSGGPGLDIIDDGKSGFLAGNAEEYALTLLEVLDLSESEASKIRAQARESVKRFSTYAFERKFARLLEPLL